jgi:hypothetical protein
MHAAQLRERHAASVAPRQHRLQAPAEQGGTERLRRQRRQSARRFDIVDERREQVRPKRQITLRLRQCGLQRRALRQF